MKRLAFGPLALKPDEFWRMTPAELNDMLEGWQRRQETKMQMIAWHAANLINMFSRRPVTVDQLLGRNRMDLEEKKAQFEELVKIARERRGNEWLNNLPI